MPVGGRNFAARFYRLCGQHMIGRVHAAQQVAFLNPNFGLYALHYRDMLIHAIVRAANDRYLFGCQVKDIVAAALDERQSLQGFGTGTHKSDGTRLAIPGKQAARGIDNSRRSKMD